MFAVLHCLFSLIYRLAWNMWFIFIQYYSECKKFYTQFEPKMSALLQPNHHFRANFSGKSKKNQNTPHEEKAFVDFLTKYTDRLRGDLRRFLLHLVQIIISYRSKFSLVKCFLFLFYTNQFVNIRSIKIYHIWYNAPIFQLKASFNDHWYKLENFSSFKISH